MQQLKCKVNQLCWIIKAQMPANIGRIVTIKEYIGWYEQEPSTLIGSRTPITGHYWKVQSSQENLETILGDFTQEIILPDLWLQPILPDEKALEYVLKSEVFTDDQVEQIKELILEGNYNHG